MKKVIIWQDKLINSLMIALLSWGHIILEWVPWLAKTLSIQTLARTLDLDFSRISFTPDLLPWDLIGWQIYNQSESKFYIKKWPIFTNFLLADEINRAPSKVQSALLEAMQEKKITIADETFALDEPFFVLATQNPIEQEWTYNLPEAQLDRFLLKITIDYPTEHEEIQIMKSVTVASDVKINKILSKNDIILLRKMISSEIFVDDKIYDYVKNLVFATRYPADHWLASISDFLSFWASPRASIWLITASKVLAFLNWRDFVTPDDIKDVATDVLRHRIGLSFEALWENISTDTLISTLLSSVLVP
ncbi:MAG: ATPase, MoxR family [uncultured bacterium (gcode 4)]|uniref:ATPase, MoxR family n=1 Tax=uncultured bacterium (gcode 4) TaxID=1234023 RepID=K2H378_9BACT|nr:MAG: ATPase, MoxR family [uncultured bacterium (gcode 4)]